MLLTLIRLPPNRWADQKVRYENEILTNRKLYAINDPLNPPKGDFSSPSGRLGGVNNLQIESFIFSFFTFWSTPVESKSN